MSDRAALLRAILRRDLASFIEQCFATLEPGTPYLDNWHVHAIAYQLIRIWRGECKRLIINVPPRSLKSICASVAFPAWVLGRDPSKRIICASYGQDLSNKLARDTHAVVTSDWYKRAFATRLMANRAPVVGSAGRPDRWSLLGPNATGTHPRLKFTYSCALSVSRQAQS